MANVQAFFYDRALEATVTSDNEDADYPSTNVATGNPQSTWKSASINPTTVTFTFTWSSSVVIGGIGVANHNLTSCNISTSDGVIASTAVPSGDFVLLDTNDTGVGTSMTVTFDNVLITSQIGAISLFPITAAQGGAAEFDDGWPEYPLGLEANHDLTVAQSARGFMYVQRWGGSSKGVTLNVRAAAAAATGDPAYDAWNAYANHGWKPAWVILDDHDNDVGTPAYYGRWDSRLTRQITHADARSSLQMVLRGLPYRSVA